MTGVVAPLPLRPAAAAQQQRLTRRVPWAQWRQATTSLREEQRHTGLEVVRLGRDNEQLRKELARRQLDADALRSETAQKEREARRADEYRGQAQERLEQLRRVEQRLASAEAALQRSRKEAADSKAAAETAAEQLALVRAPGLAPPPKLAGWLAG